MLKRVSIQNFKSLKDVTLDLQKVNLLIGPNNSGKTNFLKALEFVSDSVGGGVDFSKQDHYKRDSANELNILLIFESIYSEGKFDRVSLYRLNIDEEEYHMDITYSDTFDGDDPQAQAEDIEWKEFKEAFGFFNIYTVDPNKLDKPSPVGEGALMLNKDASNMIAFFDRMRDEYHEVFAKIRADLAECVPEFVEINFQSVKSDEKLIKEFGDKTFKRIGLTDGRQKIIYWADELSEGTLYFIALLCIINQPNPPKLLLLEEPEKGIHPRRIREVMDFIFRLAEEKDVQIILTSHNEHVLDDFATRPEAVFVFDKDEEGATYVRNLQTDIIEPTNRRNQELGLDDIDLTTNLSENWLYGLLGGVPSIP